MNDDKLEWIFASSDNQQLADRYDRWATQYDADHDGGNGSVRRKRSSSCVSRHDVDGARRRMRHRRVGVELAATGWDGTLVGVDLSAGMLAVAAETAYYERLVQASLTELPLEDGSVDAVIATGVFTHGHVGSEAFPEVLRVVRPGGWVVITCRSEVWAELEPAAADHEAAGRWSLHKRTAPESFHPGRTSRRISRSRS